MSDRINLTGMVLSSMPVGEFDRRIVLLTKERGKISAFAKNARRSKSQIAAATNPFVSGVFEAFEGRESYTIYSADISNYFEALTGDLELVWYGYYFLEIAEYFSLENVDETERLVLLYQSFRAMLAGRIPVELVRLVYEFKTLVINGDYPNVFQCQSCKKRENLIFLSSDRRGVLCSDCCGNGRGIRISPSALYTLQYIASTPSSKVYSFVLKDEILEELSYIINEYYNLYVGHSFKSESFLDL